MHGGQQRNHHGREASTVGEPAASTEQLVLGVSWPDRVPHLDLASVQDSSRTRVPVLGRLGFRVTADGRYCTGWYSFDDGGRLCRTSGWRPCPDRRRTSGSRQCADCALRDQFRFVHQGHLGGYVPRALESYLAAPHWLYLATFADGFTKVGTASATRKQARLDEQGPVWASYLAYAANGRLVREAEDEVTRRLEVPQHRRRAAKAAAYVQPAARSRVEARHQETVVQAADLLAGTAWNGDLEPSQDVWPPPPAAAALLEPPPSGSRLAYPHALSHGEHGLQVEAAAGPAVLARTEPGVDALRYVADLGQLAGCRIVLGDYTSAEAELQESLF